MKDTFTIMIRAVLLVPLISYAAVVLNKPFDPGVQDVVTGTVPGTHSYEGCDSIAESFNGLLYYRVYSDGSGTPSKVYAYNPGSMTSTVLLGAAGNSFQALKAMQGSLFISHTDGRVWKYDGMSLLQLTNAPFSSTNYVMSMAEFNGVLYFGTSAGIIYQSANGSSFVSMTTIRIGKPIMSLAAWNGHLYGVNHEDYSYSCKIFRSQNGTNWTVVGTFSIFEFAGLAASPTHLYVASTENADGPSFAVRATTNGTNWTLAYETYSVGKVLRGKPVCFAQADGRVCYITHDMSGVGRMIPFKDGVAESPIELSHPYSSVAEVDGQLYAIGAPASITRDPDVAPTAIGLLGSYRGVGLGLGVSISGFAPYSGPQVGPAHVTAKSLNGSWSATLSSPGAFEITGVPRFWDYALSAFIDANTNGTMESWEPQGQYHLNPLSVQGHVSGVSVTLVDPDRDGNGLPDWWEIKHFATIGVDPSGDPDGDNFTNLEELQEGYNPKQFNIGKIAIHTAIEVTWRSVVNTNYQVQWALTTSSNHWINLGAPITGTGSVISVLDSTRGHPAKFYRVVLTP